MAYSRGTSAQIIVGAAALFTYEADGEGAELTDALLPNAEANVSFKDTLEPTAGEVSVDGFRNVGYTMNGLELQFQPDFGEVRVDQVLDVAKLYKQGMQVNLNTTFAEATLENLLFSLASKGSNLDTLSSTAQGDSYDWKKGWDASWAGETALNMSAGDIGECPVERGLIAVGPGTGDCAVGSSIERIYVAYRALSIENVTVSAKRDEATMFEVSFRLLPNDNASYGKIIDRTLSNSNN